MLFGLREVSAIQDQKEIVEPKHYKKEYSKPRHHRKADAEPKHARKESSKPKILKLVITAEMISMILACCCIYGIWCHNIEVRHFMKIYSETLAVTTERTDEQTEKTVKTYLESIAEEVYEYAWTTKKVRYRTGADKSYKVAGTFEKDKMVKRTGITHNGWSRVTVDEKDYYVPGDAISTDIPESLPIADGIKGEYQKYALSLLPDFGWDSSELEPLIYLWNRESGWNPNSHNRGSGAHGIPQALPASKMASEGSDYYTNAEPQIRWGLKYIAGRYGSPSAAWAHFCSRGWY